MYTYVYISMVGLHTHTHIYIKQWMQRVSKAMCRQDPQLDEDKYNDRKIDRSDSLL